jgi:hypothetical protein
MAGTPEGAQRARERRRLKAQQEALDRRAAAVADARAKLEQAQEAIEDAGTGALEPPAVDPAATYPGRQREHVPADGDDLALMARAEATAGAEDADDSPSVPSMAPSVPSIPMLSDAGRALPKNQELAENLMASAAAEAAALHIQVMRSRKLPAMVRLKAASTVLQVARVGQDRERAPINQPAGMAALVAGLGRALAAKASAPGADVVTVEPEPVARS